MHPIGVHDNFFELGGDSILNLQVVAQAKRAGLQLTPKQLFDHPRIRELAPWARDAGISAGPKILAGALALTPIQRWFFDQRMPRPSRFNQAVLLEQRVHLDFAQVEEALAAVVAQHDALHCTFVCEGEAWRAELPAVRRRLQVDRLNLAAVAPSLRAQRLAGAMADLHAGLSIERGPLFRALVIEDAPETRPRLFLVAHHLSIDIVSWRILVDDLDRYCSQLKNGKRPQLTPPSSSNRDWVQWQSSEAASEITQAESVYWRGVGASAPRLPREWNAANPDTYEHARRHSVILSADQTRALRDACPKLRARMPELLLSALSAAVADWTGQQELLVQIDSHGQARKRPTWISQGPSVGSPPHIRCT